MHTNYIIYCICFTFKYQWSSVISLLLHLSFGASVDSADALPKNDRQARQVPFRGNYKFQIPEYLRYSPDAHAKTLYSNDHRGADGSFGYEYQTENGIQAKQESTGYGANKVVRGYYSYVGPDGRQYTVNYVADRFGYRAYGDHLPGQPNYNDYFLPAPARPVPTNFLEHQHHTQTAFVPTEILQSQNIYVADNSASEYVNITPRPIVSNFVTPAAFNQVAWTTQRPYVSFS